MKKKIVIASALKPVDDVRAYWKLSQSMAKTNKYEVNIIGNRGKKEEDEENIKFHAHRLNRTHWINRMLIREFILFKILRIKPSVLIITTHELINTALLAKLLIGCKVVYDVQENYGLNLRVINYSFAKGVIASLIRWKENLSKYFIDQFWLAEKCYSEELPFTRKNGLVIENKAFDFPQSTRQNIPLKMLFSGTISEYGGVKKAIELFRHFQNVDKESTLLVIGQVHDPSLKEWLEDEQKNTVGLKLNIASDPIPHDEILDAIADANLGVIGYQPSEVNHRKIPTKLYEYSRYMLPYLVYKNTLWSQVGQELGGSIPIDFEHSDADKILKLLKNATSLFPEHYPDEATWENESSKMIESLNTLIK